MKPLCIDLFSGLGGWSEGFIAEGYECIGFDIERHQYGDQKYPGHLVIQDVLTIHGSQFKDAAVIVASPPCQNYSYLAMPWSRSTNPNNSKAAKALRLKWETEGPDNRLFDACFRIQREAIEATGKRCASCAGTGCGGAGWPDPPFACYTCEGTGIETRYIPLIVENVRGANEWVSPKSTYNYGSFHLWGDVPAIMPRGAAVKVPSASGRRTDVGSGVRFTSRDCGIEGTKIGGDWFSDPQSTCRKHGSRSNARKAASAQIAKIPLPLSSYIARVYYPKRSLEQAS